MMFLKDPAATLDYTLDWAPWLADDRIESSAWHVPDDLVVVRQGVDGTRCTVWLAGGVPGRLYSVTNRIATASGRVDERSIAIRCQER